MENPKEFNSQNTDQDKARKEHLERIKQLAEKAQKTAEAKQAKLFEGEDLGAEDLGVDVSFLNDTADPDLSHRLYYTMYNIMRRNLPSGKDNEELRRYVYDEIGLFLNRGKEKNERGVRNSDMRMAYIPTFLKPAFDIVVKWVTEGAAPFDLYEAFRRKNEEMGYGRKI